MVPVLIMCILDCNTALVFNVEEFKAVLIFDKHEWIGKIVKTWQLHDITVVAYT